MKDLDPRLWRSSRMAQWGLLIAVIALFAIAHAVAAEKSSLKAEYVPQGPKIDGTLTDPIWKKGALLTLNTVTGLKTEFKTTAHVLFDAENMYVGFECEEPDPTSIRAGAAGRDGTVWEDDCVELFVIPIPNEGYFQIEANTKGVIFDQRCTAPRQGDRDWNSNPKIAVKLGEKAWTLTLSVPLKDFGPKQGENQTWKFNLNRTRPARGEAPERELSWAPLPSSNYHDPDAFGELTGIRIGQNPTAQGPKEEGKPVVAQAPPKPEPTDDASKIGQPAANEPKDPPQDYFQKLYKDYKPAFLRYVAGNGSEGVVGWHWGVQHGRTSEQSEEKGFNCFNLVSTEDRVDALIAAARKKEANGETREALQIYQKVVEQFPQTLYRVNEYGLFVPAARYCQLRLLALPAADLAFYRTIYDPKAKESYDQARRQYSTVDFQEIVDSMLATSYGDNALWEMGNAALDKGHFEEALEHFRLIRELFQGGDTNTPELALKVAYCEKKLNRMSAPGTVMGKGGKLPAEQEALFREVVNRTVAEPENPSSRLASAPLPAANDYYPFEPTTDPVAAADPAWRVSLPDSQRDFAVYTHPVVTADSVLFRNKNILYCHSLINGMLRWKWDLGGRVSIQQPGEQVYRMEDALVRDNLVYTNVLKSGFSLAALELNTGQIKWAAGALAPVRPQDMLTRYEAAPALDSQTVYAGYIFDDVKEGVEGSTHFDTLYGMRAFDSETGRMLWDSPICRMTPGKISTNVASRRRILVRSFSSPPLLHQGTIYYNTNAGSVAALDARTGRIKWIMRHPYWLNSHDATQNYDQARAWYPQRPLAIGDYLFVAPVDAPMLFCIERASGKVVWTRMKGKDFNGHAGHRYLDEAYLLGPTRDGMLVLVYGGRWGPVELIDPKNGQTVWESPDLIKPESSPAMALQISEGIEIQNYPFRLGARPMLTSDDRLYVSAFDTITAGSNQCFRGMAYNLTCLSLSDRRIVAQRRFYDATVCAAAQWLIQEKAPDLLKNEKLPKPERERYQAIAEDKVPRNEHGPFMPMVRMTCTRFGVPFEVRCGPREVSVVYEYSAVAKALHGKEDPLSRFYRAELALAQNQTDEANKLLIDCLATTPSNEVEFRERVHRLLYQVELLLAQQSIRQSKADREREHALGLSASAGSITEEIQSLLALADSAERQSDPDGAARYLRALVLNYNAREYAVAEGEGSLGNHLEALNSVFEAAGRRLNKANYTQEFEKPLGLIRKNLGVYESAVSPLPRTLNLEAGLLAARRLLLLRGRWKEWAQKDDEAARAVLGAAPAEDLLKLLQVYPGTDPSQQALNKLLAEQKNGANMEDARRLWILAETAQRSGLKLSENIREKTSYKDLNAVAEPIGNVFNARETAFPEDEVLRLVLQRRDNLSVKPNLVFVAGRAQKRLDNKFELLGVDLSTGKRFTFKEREDASQIRLHGIGEEAGFSEAFVCGNLVIVHGLYDVLAFELESGLMRWRYRTPHDFKIRHALAAGDLLILSDPAQTIALYIPTKSPAGEVVWEVAENGEPYLPAYTRKNCLISLRRSPDNVTSRHLGTGRLSARLDLPTLSSNFDHPSLQGAPAETPAVNSGDLLIVTDGQYYICVDTAKMEIAWKRRIDSNDPTRVPPIRFATDGKYLVVLKQDFEHAALHGLNLETGDLLWATAKDPKTAPPLYSAFLENGKVFGLQPRQRGFQAIQLDAQTGKVEWQWESTDYKETAEAQFVPRLFGKGLVVRIMDGQRFDLLVLNAGADKSVYTLSREGVGPYGQPGRASCLIQNGHLLLWTKNGLGVAGP